MKHHLPSPLFMGSFLLLGAFFLGAAFGNLPLFGGNQHLPDTEIRKSFIWPERISTDTLKLEEKTRLSNLLKTMTTEQKVGQLIIADISSLVPEDLEEYPLGAILAGGNSAPNGERFTDTASWLKFADEIYEAAKRADTPAFVPPLFGIDAVHGHNNVLGAVIFPHNVGLGAANDKGLTQKIGAATARSLAATGHDWTFAPTVAVAQDTRWGRAYESYSIDPNRVRTLTQAFINGVQSEYVGNGMILATAKHFIADGGTFEGKDQGDAKLSEAELAAVHGPGFFGALDENVATVMASYSSWNGKKLHGHEYLLQTILKERLAFDGFVVGDWDAHAQIEGCTPSDCSAAINAGVDMLMAPIEWKALFSSLLTNVEQGVIPTSRLDDAVMRILKIKLKAGLLDSKRPSSRKGAGDNSAIDSPQLRKLARNAVRASQVMLKNSEHTLPIRNTSKITVVGFGADDIPTQCGGWCLSWQSDGLTRTNFLQGETILDGIKAHAAHEKIDISYNADGSVISDADLAIIVLHSKPYAEYYGDTETLALPEYNADALKALKYYKKSGVPVVTILISGRPLWTHKQLNDSSAFLASWLPGTQGGGVADVLFGKTLDGKPINLQGRLPFPWLDDNTFVPTQNRPAIFDVGYGLRYSPNDLIAGKTQPNNLTLSEGAQ